MIAHLGPPPVSESYDAFNNLVQPIGGTRRHKPTVGDFGCHRADDNPSHDDYHDANDHDNDDADQYKHKLNRPVDTASDSAHTSRGRRYEREQRADADSDPAESSRTHILNRHDRNGHGHGHGHRDWYRNRHGNWYGNKHGYWNRDRDRNRHRHKYRDRNGDWNRHKHRDWNWHRNRHRHRNHDDAPDDHPDRGRHNIARVASGDGYSEPLDADHQRVRLED